MTPIEVRVSDCECPNAPHGEGDVVYVAPTPSLTLGLHAKADISEALGNGSLLRELWLVTFVRYGALGWNRLDEDGDPIPFDVEALLADFAKAVIVAEKCDELYGDAVTAPLVARLRNISRSGRMDDSSSTTPKSTTKRRGRSSRAGSAASRR